MPDNHTYQKFTKNAQIPREYLSNSYLTVGSLWQS